MIDWLAIPILVFAAAQGPLPEDVAAFIDRRQSCGHFRGEEPYDAERRAFLEAQMHAHCQGTDHELARLRAAYATRADVLDQLAEFEDRIEPCAISGATIQWQGDYCLMEMQTDDLIAARSCLEREGLRRFPDACTFTTTSARCASRRSSVRCGRARSKRASPTPGSSARWCGMTVLDERVLWVSTQAVGARILQTVSQLTSSANVPGAAS